VSTVTVLRVDPRSDVRWAALAAGPGGGLFTSPPWITAVCATYGFDATAAVVVDGEGTPLAGFAWVDVDDLRGRRRLALPFCDRADPIVADADGWAAVSRDALDDDLPLTLRCLDGSPAADDGRLTRTGEAAWHRTPLTGSLDDLHGRLRSQTRRNIAAAERRGVRVRSSADPDALHVYHDLHVGLRKRKYRLLAQPRELLDRIWAAFSPFDGVRTTIATVDGRPVAGAVHLVWQDTVYYKFGASLAEHLALRPNDAVHWALIRWAHDRGLAHLDWGLSDLDQPGLVGYKRNWASEERRILTLNAGGPPRGRRPETEHLLRTLTALFTDDSVPDAITARAGAALYGLFC
jgi:CelD/BcsL family acetyltransferase involved in cellulose biosynthesis